MIQLRWVRQEVPDPSRGYIVGVIKTLQFRWKQDNPTITYPCIVYEWSDWQDVPEVNYDDIDK